MSKAEPAATDAVPAAADHNDDNERAAAVAAEVVRRRRIRRDAGATAFVGALVVHALAFDASWREAGAAMLPTAPLAAATTLAALATGAAIWLAARTDKRQHQGGLAQVRLVAHVERARELERGSLLWPLWGATALGPLLLALPTAGAGFDRLVTGAWSTTVAAHVALLLISWTTSERLARASDRTVAAALDASGGITWALVAAVVTALGQVLGRPVLVLGLALGGFAALSYLVCVRLAAERAALRGAARGPEPRADASKTV